MDIGSSFTYMFNDPDRVRKLGIGTVIALASLLLSPILIGLLGWFIVAGYGLTVIRNVLAGRSVVMPEWEDWSSFLTGGFKVAVAVFVWSLPLIVALLPLLLGAAMVDDSSAARGAQAAGTLLILCGSCLSIVWGIFVALVTPAIYVRIAQTDSLSSAFDFAKIWSFTKDNIGNVIIVVLLGIVAGIIAALVGMLGVVALVIGLLVTVPFASFWQILVQSHLYAQVAVHSVTAIE
jgi:hypothetical protein